MALVPGLVSGPGWRLPAPAPALCVTPAPPAYDPARSVPAGRSGRRLLQPSASAVSGPGTARCAAPSPHQPGMAVLLTIPALSALWLRWEVVSEQGFTDNAVALIDESAIRGEVARLMTDEVIKKLTGRTRPGAARRGAERGDRGDRQALVQAVWKDGHRHRARRG